MATPKQRNVEALYLPPGVAASGSLNIGPRESTKERDARVGERGKQSDHRRKVEWVVLWTIVVAVGVALIGCLAVILWPGRDPDAVKLAFGMLTSIITGGLGVVAGRGMKAAEG